jgi:hypothetical protein
MQSISNHDDLVIESLDDSTLDTTQLPGWCFILAPATTL